MDAAAIIATLRKHELDLRRLGLAGPVLFGSTARGHASPSDIDLAARFDPAARVSLIELVRIERKLSALLGHRVDLVQASALKPAVRARVEREAIHAF